MRVDRSVCDIGSLVKQITNGEIKLPEIQRRYVWSPEQLARFTDSLYRGYPSGSLVCWKTAPPPRTRVFDISDCRSQQPLRDPLYLIDGQQRLTAIHRLLSGHPDAQIVFDIQTEHFTKQSSKSAGGPGCLSVSDVIGSRVGLAAIAEELRKAGCTLDPGEVRRRLDKLAAISDYTYHVQVLSDTTDDEVTEIFLRLNSGGRALQRSDHAMAVLSVRKPGILDQFEIEANYWAKEGYNKLDPQFLAHTMTCTLLGSGLSESSITSLKSATHQDLDDCWRTVHRGLGDLVPLLKNNLKISHSSLLPSMNALIPLIILLGERPDESMDSGTVDSILYWLLVATSLRRYSGAAETRLGQDLKAARQPSPELGLLQKLGIIGKQVEITANNLAGQSVTSPYFLLSFLVCQQNGARDWWHGARIAAGGSGGHKLEHHHIHPRATLIGRPEKYTSAEIDDLANFAFISAKANKKISDRHPSSYFSEIPDYELAAHFIPLDNHLRDAGSYREFLAARRDLLARAMTSFLGELCPTWLAKAPCPPPGATVNLTIFESPWDTGRILITAHKGNFQWEGVVSQSELSMALEADTDELDEDLDISISGQPTAVLSEGDNVQIQFGPFLVTGTVTEWEKVLKRARAGAQPLSQCPAHSIQPWEVEPILFPVTGIDCS